MAASWSRGIPCTPCMPVVLLRLTQALPKPYPPLAPTPAVAVAVAVALTRTCMPAVVLISTKRLWPGAQQQRAQSSERSTATKMWFPLAVS